MNVETGSGADTQPPASLGGARESKPPAGRQLGSKDDRRRLVARLVIAFGVAAVICLLLGRFAAPHLEGPTDIVGYPTFWNFNFERSFWYYRLTVYAFPVFTIVGYMLLVRFGPLRPRGPRPAKRDNASVESNPVACSTPEHGSLGSLTRILLPAAVVVSACAARKGHIDLIAVAAGGTYLAVVVAVAETWAHRTGGQRRPALSRTNGVGGAVAAVLSLWFVSAHTTVQTATGVQSWPWLVWWLPVLGVFAIGWWAARQFRGGREARDVELTLLTVVVGAIALFLAMSVLPGQIMHFQGFDDAVEMAGASVTARGYFPWRDVLFIHGVFPDVLVGSLGVAIFGDSIWGVFAVHTAILVPLFWVSSYFFAVWVGRRNPWFLTLVFLAATSLVRPLLDSEPLTGPRWELLWSERFLGVPVVLIVLGETVRRRSVAWAVGLTLLLFLEEILVPETIFVAGPALACMVASDLVQRRPGRSLWTKLRLTRWCIGTGLVATAALATFLTVFSALGAFVDYYLVFGPGHNMAGAIPPTGISPTEITMIVVDIGCVVLTIWLVAVKVAARAGWEARDWVAVAAGAFVALYLEKALGRFDTVHVWQVFGASLPLVLLWSWRGFHALDRWLADWRRRRDARLLRVARPVVAVLVPLVAIGFAFVGPLRKASGQHFLTGVNNASFGRLGYALPEAIDTGLLRDLDTAIRTYAGGDGPVFDMTNSPGYLYFVLGRTPGTRFVHVSMAIPEYAQRLLIDELKAARPPVVIYDADSIGMPTWDGITNNVRHYDVSEYVLRGWTPVLRVHGVLVMARNDLITARPVPSLTTPPQTTNLYFSGPACDWGATPNYLVVPASGGAKTLSVHSTSQQMVVNFAGWAVDPATSRPATSVLFADGDRVIGTVTPSLDRPDVAQHLHQPKSVSGFRYTASFDPAVHPSAYLLGADGVAHPIGGSQAASVAALRLPDGSQVRVAATSGGNLEVHTADVYLISEVQLPNQLNLRDYDLATLTSTGGLGGSIVALTDQPGRLYHNISASWLDKSGPRLALRVGSCPQWYGYDPSKPLYVMQSGGPPVTSLTLSAKRV